MPVRVDYLSRARTTKETREVLDALKEGKIDILIGTHKAISKTVKWHDLGLLVIDEEQKFGVSTKEKLRQAQGKCRYTHDECHSDSANTPVLSDGRPGYEYHAHSAT